MILSTHYQVHVWWFDILGIKNVGGRASKKKHRFICVDGFFFFFFLSSSSPCPSFPLLWNCSCAFLKSIINNEIVIDRLKIRVSLLESKNTMMMAKDAYLFFIIKDIKRTNGLSFFCFFFCKSATLCLFKKNNNNKIEHSQSLGEWSIEKDQ